MPRWSDTPHIIHDSQWFYSKYKDDDHVVTWNINSPKKKKRESNTKSNSLDFTGCKTILGQE